MLRSTNLQVPSALASRGGRGESAEPPYPPHAEARDKSLVWQVALPHPGGRGGKGPQQHLLHAIQIDNPNFSDVGVFCEFTSCMAPQTDRQDTHTHVGRIIVNSFFPGGAWISQTLGISSPTAVCYNLLHTYIL